MICAFCRAAPAAGGVIIRPSRCDSADCLSTDAGGTKTRSHLMYESKSISDQKSNPGVLFWRGGAPFCTCCQRSLVISSLSALLICAPGSNHLVTRESVHLCLLLSTSNSLIFLNLPVLNSDRRLSVAVLYVQQLFSRCISSFFKRKRKTNSGLLDVSFIRRLKVKCEPPPPPPPPSPPA